MFLKTSKIDISSYLKIQWTDIWSMKSNKTIYLFFLVFLKLFIRGTGLTNGRPCSSTAFQSQDHFLNGTHIFIPKIERAENYTMLHLLFPFHGFYTSETFGSLILSRLSNIKFRSNFAVIRVSVHLLVFSRLLFPNCDRYNKTFYKIINNPLQ